MRLAMLVTDLQRGGAPLRLARIALHLRDRGVRVAVGCLSGRGPLHRELERAGLTTFACDARHALDWRALLRLQRMLRGLQPDLLFATLMHANVGARLVGRRLGVPVLTSTATIEIERRWHARVERLTASLDAGCVVNSQALADHVITAHGRSRDGVHVIPPAVYNGAEIDGGRDGAAMRADLRLSDERINWLWVGRMDPVKRLDIVLATHRRLGDGSQLLLAGDGPEAEQFARQPGLRPLGWRHDIGALLRAVDFLVLPSDTEGLPNVVLEALWCGTPVVATDLPALRELADRGAPLTLVRPVGDRRDERYAEGVAEQFAQCLRRGRSSADERERARGWARRHLDPEAAVEALLGVFAKSLRA